MAENIKVAISSDFLTAFARLPKTIQGKVTEFVNKFRNDPTSTGINYEKISHAIDNKLYSARVDNSYRCIVVRQQESGVYLLLWVDNHEEAYKWALKKKCEVNPYTGTIQVYDVQTVTETVAEPTQNLLFSDVSDDDLLKLGLPSELLAYVKGIDSKDTFYNSETVLPHDAYENLSWLAEGFEVEEVLQLVEGQNTSNSDKDLSAALDVPSTLSSFVVIEGEDELRRIMAEPLEKWRVFLHPMQRKIVMRDYSGPARVLGGAGTGKTVVAMHRAKYLASRLPEGQRILFTTFTANLAADIKDNLKKICTSDELDKIEVIHLDLWVSFFLREAGYSVHVEYGDEIDKLWEKALIDANNDLPYDLNFYKEEWNRVVIAQEALSLEKYCRATRNGRGVRLDRKKRMQIWKVFENYQNLMKESSKRDINTAMYESSVLLQTMSHRPSYAHIVVDEGQDFSNNAYRLLRALAGEEHENDIFVVGDSHQRIYNNYPRLSKCGINLRGRSNILKINYRTTEEIRTYAFAVLNGISFDDLDEGFDQGDKCQSLTHGENPIIKNFSDVIVEFAFIADEIRLLLKSGVNSNDICVVCRTKKLVDGYITQFSKSGLQSFAIKRNRIDDRNYNGIRVATMHRVKGLEFKYVFISALNDRFMPLQSAIDNSDPISKAESITAEKCLLYVAMTRAQKGVYITSYGTPSEFIS